MVATLHDLVKTEKKVYHCHKCKSVCDTRIHRGPLVKVFLFFLPLRRYVCLHCKRKFYVWH
jgi:hypothetical protein